MTRNNYSVITLEDHVRALNAYQELQKKYKKKKDAIDKAIELLEKGIIFCENDSQGIYNKCNIAINREKKTLDILKEVS